MPFGYPGHPSERIVKVMELRALGWEKSRIAEAMRAEWPDVNLNKLAGIIHRNRERFDVPELTPQAHSPAMRRLIAQKAWVTRRLLYGRAGTMDRAALVERLRRARALQEEQKRKRKEASRPHG
jgi:hypothetical protein